MFYVRKSYDHFWFVTSLSLYQASIFIHSLGLLASFIGMARALQLTTEDDSSHSSSGFFLLIKYLTIYICRRSFAHVVQSDTLKKHLKTIN